jgi:hypothetical protein
LGQPDYGDAFSFEGKVMRFVLLLLPIITLFAAFQYVSRQIASGQTAIPFAGTAVTLKPIDPNSVMGPSFSFDSREKERLNGENIANQTRLFNQRMEDMRNYAKNPAGWHGAPPF